MIKRDISVTTLLVKKAFVTMDVTFFEHLSYYSTNDLQEEISKNEDRSWYDTPIVLPVVPTTVQDKARQVMDGEMNEQSEPIIET